MDTYFLQTHSAQHTCDELSTIIVPGMKKWIITQLSTIIVPGMKKWIIAHLRKYRNKMRSVYKSSSRNIHQAFVFPWKTCHLEVAMVFFAHQNFFFFDLRMFIKD